MSIPTEPIGSIPRPLSLIQAINAVGDGTDPSLEALYDAATRDTIEQFEEVPEFLDLQRPRTEEHESRWIQNPVRGRPHTAHAASDGRAISL